MNNSTQIEIMATPQVRQALDMAARVMGETSGRVGLVFGGAGSGKSCAARYIAEGNADAVLVCAYPRMTQADLLGEIWPHLGWKPDPGGAPEVSQMAERVGGLLLVVDDADRLRWQELDLLMYLADEAGMGLILVGTDLLDRCESSGATRDLGAKLAWRIGPKQVRMAWPDRDASNEKSPLHTTTKDSDGGIEE